MDISNHLCPEFHIVAAVVRLLPSPPIVVQGGVTGLPVTSQSVDSLSAADEVEAYLAHRSNVCPIELVEMRHSK